MKNKIWLLQIPIVLLMTGAFAVTDLAMRGDLQNPFLRETLSPPLRTLTGWFTNAKFKIRGPQKPKNKIVIVEVDSPSLAEPRLGRWPWHRNVTADLIHNTFAAGARVVGLDMVFSERDPRVPPELADELKAVNLGNIREKYETDPLLEKTILEHQDHLITGWITENSCQPAYDKPDDCPVSNPEVIKLLPENFEKFAFSKIEAPYGFDPKKTPLLSALDFIANIPEYNGAAKHSGSFNVTPDPDHFIRRTGLAYTSNGQFYPTLALEVARLAKNDFLKVSIDSDNKISEISLEKSGIKIPVTPLGVMEINFRGPGRTFPYISALDMFSNKDEVEYKDGITGEIKKGSKKELLNDAIVFIGVTAVGVFDMRAFPFDSNVAGVEGHANIVDNILSGDMLRSLIKNSPGITGLLIYFLMSVFALAFAFLTERLESRAALALFLGTFALLTVADVFVLFSKFNINLNLGFFAVELILIFVHVFIWKYYLEEKNKKEIKNAFNKYVSPAVVDSILKDPTKLSLGGEKRDLTILFSDIRSFTTFSERLDAKELAHFLNDYLGIMTDIVFDNEGTLDKYIGDAVMAFWGAPLDQPKHALHSVNSAIKMMAAVHQNRERFLKQYGVEVNVGVGLNTGTVNVGNMGSSRVFEYTVIGDHVNLASRLESLTKHYGANLLTTRFTMDAVEASGESLPEYRTIDITRVKGKKNAVEVIQILDREFSQEGLKKFNEARNLFLGRKFDDALKLFKEANVLLKTGPEDNDGPTMLYLDRIETFLKEPPGDDWDGAWTMHSK